MSVVFTTSRLKISETTVLTPITELNLLLDSIPGLLSPAVVANLPHHFHNITTFEQANCWLTDMLEQSRLFAVYCKNEQCLIGLVFTSCDSEIHTHLGYLLDEKYWGKGLASELLTSFIDKVIKPGRWEKLLAGVDVHNVASSRLLKKLGFTARDNSENDVVFYELSLKKQQ